MKWRTLSGQSINDPIIKAVEKVVQREKKAGYKLKVCIGTDSQVYGPNVEYATVIVFLREKKGGFMFIHNEKVKQSISIKERLLNEVAKSIDIAYQLCDLLNKHEIDMEVHADINTNPQFESNSALRDAMGYILGMGFQFKAKPDAFASSTCADKIVN